MIISIHENQDRLNQNRKPIPKHETCVCCELEHITLFSLYNGSKQKLNYVPRSSCRALSPSRLDPNRDPPSLTPTSAIYDLDARALESPSEKIQNSFVEANHQLIS